MPTPASFALCLALQLATGPAGGARMFEPSPADPAQPDPETQVRDLYYEGSTLYSAADYAGAIEKFTRALHVATVNKTDPTIRGALLMNLATAHVRSYDIDEDTAHLHKAVHIYRRYLKEAPMLGYPDKDVAEARERKAELEAQLEALKRDKAPAPVAAPDPAQEPAPAAAPADTPADTPAGNKARGLALVGVGGGVLAGGIAMLAVGAVFKPRAQKQVDKFNDPPEQEQSFVDDEARKGVIWMASGGAAAAVGLGVLIGGIVDLARAKKASGKTAGLHVSPWMGRSTSGLVLSGRF